MESVRPLSDDLPQRHKWLIAVMDVARAALFCGLVMGVVIGAEWWISPNQPIYSSFHCEICAAPATISVDAGFGTEHYCRVHGGPRKAELADWPKPVALTRLQRYVDGIAIRGDDLTDADVAKIRMVIASLPSDIDKRILSIVRVSDNQVEVTTGEVRGPLDANGNMIILKRQGVGWQAVRATSWLS